MSIIELLKIEFMKVKRSMILPLREYETFSVK